jgi:hypothetical protein
MPPNAVDGKESTISGGDVWSSTDSSLFDKPTSLPPKVLPQALSPAGTKSHTHGDAITRSHDESKEDLDRIRIVKNIVQNLPDLSYMLRR